MILSKFLWFLTNNEIKYELFETGVKIYKNGIFIYSLLTFEIDNNYENIIYKIKKDFNLMEVA